MTSYVTPKKNTAFIIYAGLFSQTSPATLVASPTLAAGDFKVSIDGGATANLATLPTNTPAASGQIKISLSAAEMNGDNITVTGQDAAGDQWSSIIINIQTSARQIDDLAYPATSGRSMVVDAAGLVDANTVKVGPTGSGTAQTAADIPARLPAALVSGRIDASVGAMAANVMTAAAANADLTTELQAGLATAANLATVAGYLDTEIAAILADTNELQTDWADGGRLGLILDARSSQTSVDDLPTNAELATALGTADDGILAQVALVKAQTDLIPSDPADASVIAGRFDTLDTSVGDLPTNAELAAALAGADDAVLAAIAALVVPTADQNATALLDQAAGVEANRTLRQALRIMLAALAGKASGMATTTAVYRDTNDAKDRITATVDADGNRSTVTLDAS